MPTSDKKRLKSCGELNFLLGVVLLGLGTSLISLCRLGVGSTVAPAYVLSARFTAIPAGTMCYIKQGVLVIATCFVSGRFKLKYLFSFLSAVIFGLCVDFFSLVCFPGLSDTLIWQRILIFALGQLCGSLGVALLFHTYFPPQAPELFVQELSHKHGWQVYKTKYVYDICSCSLSIALSFILLGRWELSILGPGTVVSALVNGPLIGFWSRLIERMGNNGPAIAGLGRLFEEK